MMTDEPPTSATDPEVLDESRIPWIMRFAHPWLILPVSLFVFLCYDFGSTLMQYRARVKVVKELVRPGLLKEQVYRDLALENFVVGWNNEACYVETMIRRPLCVRAGIWCAQTLKIVPRPWHRLMPLEMCLVYLNANGRVRENDWFAHWFR